ncbi:MAG: hypothetical protein JXR39_11670 [Marinilabiliaceae bacterium]|nr:hypothetical protein [Marinilabiliaceae bacterium]
MTDDQQYLLAYHPENASAAYGVNLYIDEGDDKEQRIQFIATISYCRMMDETMSIFHLRKEDLVINGNRSDEHSINLAKECNKAFYPITVITDQRGLLAAIRTDGFMDRWKPHRVQMERYFGGATAKQYMDATEVALNNTESIEKLVYGDHFFAQYFRMVHGLQLITKGINFTTQLHLVPFKDAQAFKCRQTINLELLKDDTSNNYEVEQQGEMSDLVKVRDLFPTRFSDVKMNEQMVTGHFSMTYQLHKSTNFIESMIGNYHLDANGSKLMSIKLEAYHLADRQIPEEEDKELKKMAAKNKKSFLENTLDYLFT